MRGPCIAPAVRPRAHADFNIRAVSCRAVVDCYGIVAPAHAVNELGGRVGLSRGPPAVPIGRAVRYGLPVGPIADVVIARAARARAVPYLVLAARIERPEPRGVDAARLQRRDGWQQRANLRATAAARGDGERRDGAAVGRVGDFPLRRDQHPTLCVSAVARPNLHVGVDGCLSARSVEHVGASAERADSNDGVGIAVDFRRAVLRKHPVLGSGVVEVVHPDVRAARLCAVGHVERLARLCVTDGHVAACVGNVPLLAIAAVAPP